MYEAICLSGGGCKGVALLGLLYEWDTREKLRDIKIWSTCSVGTLIAVCLLSGLNPLQILAYFPKIETIKPSLDLVTSFFTKSGIMRIQKFTKKLVKHLQKFTGIENPTLEDFYNKTGKLLYIEAVNKTRGEIVYFNHIEHPNVPLFEAIWASAAIPGIFIPIKIGEDRFIDGGLYNSVPIEPIQDKKIIAFVFENLNEEDDLLYILKLPSMIAKKQALKNAQDIHIIECKSNFASFDFSKTKSELLDEFNFGRRQYIEQGEK